MAKTKTSFVSPTKFSLSGTPSGGRPKGAKNKSTEAARIAIASFIDGNGDRLQGWLEEIYQEGGAKEAFKAFSDLLEYHVPKLARTEVTGQDEGPVELSISWSRET
jgi:hypothetical protein